MLREGSEHAVPQPVFVLDDGIFVGAKQVEPFVEEPLQPNTGLLAGGGVPQVVEVSGRRGIVFFHVLPGIFFDLTEVHCGQFGNLGQHGLGHLLAVVFVEAPLPARRFLAVHQHVQPSPLKFVVVGHEPA